MSTDKEYYIKLSWIEKNGEAYLQTSEANLPFSDFQHMLDVISKAAGERWLTAKKGM